MPSFVPSFKFIILGLCLVLLFTVFMMGLLSSEDTEVKAYEKFLKESELRRQKVYYASMLDCLEKRSSTNQLRELSIITFSHLSLISRESQRLIVSNRQRTLLWNHHQCMGNQPTGTFNSFQGRKWWKLLTGSTSKFKSMRGDNRKLGWHWCLSPVQGCLFKIQWNHSNGRKIWVFCHWYLPQTSLLVHSSFLPSRL